MNLRKWVNEIAEESGEDLLVMDGFDDAILGVTDSFGAMRVVYCRHRIISILVEEGLSEEEAWDHYGFNIQSAYVGEHTPVIITRPDPDQVFEALNDAESSAPSAPPYGGGASGVRPR